MTETLPDQVQRAFTVAVQSRLNSHSPYSKFKVGAALKVLGQPEFFGGCNIENASFGATVCAERTAVLKAVSQAGAIRLEFLVVVTDQAQPAVPCALCLQVLAEFAGDDLVVYLANLNGVQNKYSLSDLLPHAFRSFTAAESSK